MTRPKIRPTFSVPLALDADTAIDEMRRRLDASEWVACTKSKGRCADFFIQESERRIWSPHLTVQVDARPDEGRSRLRGRFSPSPEVWTLFMFLYFGVAFLGVMGLMLGLVQWQSGMEPWGFWGVYLGLPGILLLYLVSRVGQHLSTEQMEELRGRVDALVDGLEADEDSTT
jgi:hypothetical protein